MEKDRASPSRETRERDRDGVSPLDAEYDAERVREYVREYACESGSRASRGAYGARAATRLTGVAGVRGVCANVPRDARADAGTATDLKPPPGVARSEWSQLVLLVVLVIRWRPHGAPVVGLPLC